ncbi:MAG TPA: DUF429 domain-containing protein [Burkholderiales bacterium]
MLVEGEELFLGADGCRGGWFYVTLSAEGVRAYGVARDASALGELCAGVRLALVDIPIGLKDSGEAERQCDRAARRVLGGPRAASVFRPPARPALYLAAADIGGDSYAAACARNHAATGKRLTRQAYAICGKIREIDGLLCARPELRHVICESHPEVCFWALNGGRATVHNKKRAAGRAERIAILEKYLPDAGAMFETAAKVHPRKEVGRDDILDALVCAVAARFGPARLRGLPAEPETDARGLPMRILYPDL